MEINYYYDNNGFYTHQMPANAGSLPPQNAVRFAPTFEAGFWPQLVDGTWQNKENHTNRTYEGQPQIPTDYWLASDAWDSPARHMSDLGPLPAGALLSAPAKPLDIAKAEAKEQLKAYRQNVEYGGFMLNGQKWDSEQKDELRLNSAYKIFEAGAPEYPGWKVSDGVYVTLTPELLQAATMGLMQHYGRAFAVEAAKIAEIDALTTTADVEAWLETELEEGWSQNA